MKAEQESGTTTPDTAQDRTQYPCPKAPRRPLITLASRVTTAGTYHLQPFYTAVTSSVAACVTIRVMEDGRQREEGVACRVSGHDASCEIRDAGFGTERRGCRVSRVGAGFEIRDSRCWSEAETPMYIGASCEMRVA